MEKKTLFQKAGELFGSLRFWIITLGEVITLLKLAQAGGLDIISALTSIQVYIGVVAGVGTIDSIAQKLGGKSTPPDQA